VVRARVPGIAVQADVERLALPQPRKALALLALMMLEFRFNVGVELLERFERRLQTRLRACMGTSTR